MLFSSSIPYMGAIAVGAMLTTWKPTVLARPFVGCHTKQLTAVFWWTHTKANGNWLTSTNPWPGVGRFSRSFLFGGCPTKIRIIRHIGKYIPSLNSIVIWLSFYRPHCGGPRQVQPGQRIHESVFESVFNPKKDGSKKGKRKSQHYKPKAHIGNGILWEDRKKVEEQLENIRIERDEYSSPDTVLKSIGESLKKSGTSGNESGVSEKDLDVLATLASSGKQILYDALVSNPEHFWFAQKLADNRSSMQQILLSRRSSLFLKWNSIETTREKDILSAA
jgi:hypothetical protein